MEQQEGEKCVGGIETCLIPPRVVTLNLLRLSHLLILHAFTIHYAVLTLNGLLKLDWLILRLVSKGVIQRPVGIDAGIRLCVVCFKVALMASGIRLAGGRLISA